MSRNILYQETWVVPFFPLVFFLPCFYSFGVIISEDELIFGYGLMGPWTGVTAKRIHRKDIERVYDGNWSWKENLLNLGGWGIRYGRIATRSSSTVSPLRRGWAYNASNGPFVVIELQGGQLYQFVTKDPSAVTQLLRLSTREA